MLHIYIYIYHTHIHIVYGISQSVSGTCKLLRIPTTSGCDLLYTWDDSTEVDFPMENLGQKFKRHELLDSLPENGIHYWDPNYFMNIWNSWMWFFRYFDMFFYHVTTGATQNAVWSLEELFAASYGSPEIAAGSRQNPMLHPLWKWSVIFWEQHLWQFQEI